MASADVETLELNNGDRMAREEFHRIYRRMKKQVRAELVGGIVYLASPLKRSHGVTHKWVNMLFGIYEGHTPGVESGDNATVLLGDEGEPQPDQYMRILPELGGQSGNSADDYVEGPPELLVEVSHSSKSLDLHAKLNDYRRYGVREYLVICLHEKQIRWFDLACDQELQPDADGVYRLRTFPGLWVNGQALLAGDFQKITETLNQGLATAEHAAYVQQLAERKKGAG